MRPQFSALAILYLAAMPAAFAQTAEPITSSDIAKGDYGIARMRPLQFGDEADRIAAPRDNALPSDARLSHDQAWAPHVLALGPFRMDIGSSDFDRNGRPVHFARVHLDDVHVLGGNISGTFDGRAATLRLSWPTGG